MRKFSEAILFYINLPQVRISMCLSVLFLPREIAITTTTITATTTITTTATNTTTKQQTSIHQRRKCKTERPKL
jgi:hypothetical protein